MNRKGWILKVPIVLHLILMSSCSNKSSEKELAPYVSLSSETIQLSTKCPPGFLLNENNECVAKNLYQQYESLQDVGVGGLKTALPEVRDGFSPQQIDLGRYLFFDPVLSVNGKVSCATCHQPEKGFSDGKAVSKGVNGTALTRSSPSLWNVAYLQKFFWDARATSLEAQLQDPLFSADEMGNTPENLKQTMNSIPLYRRLFKDAFPNKNQNDSIEVYDIYTALAAFETSLISLNSKYDQYAHGFKGALNEREIEGLNIFRSFVARCAECHTPPLFTNQQVAVIGTPEPEGKARDVGAEKTFNDPSRRGGFKVPSLRNIEKTAPYMHSGKFQNLRETVEFYTKGRGHAVPKGEKLYLHWHIWEPNLSEKELDLLVDFLKTLTDESFMPMTPDLLPSEMDKSVDINS
ncbi:cytochrome c peroxidase [Lutimonas halocynthiae]|uniref:cytochrome-c peroxidase n=1 Tax=Lutimonas halocynthiae TaxID=1446477 RepID=UPI0025B45D06|nr:cytochrome c peroxidase [Lutimonas halocynthiae]MDN3642643.1 cytochrome c peroxidase [Lutimonas halocynthiae]